LGDIGVMKGARRMRADTSALLERAEKEYGELDGKQETRAVMAPAPAAIQRLWAMVEPELKESKSRKGGDRIGLDS